MKSIPEAVRSEERPPAATHLENAMVTGSFAAQSMRFEPFSHAACAKGRENLTREDTGDFTSVRGRNGRAVGRTEAAGNGARAGNISQSAVSGCSHDNGPPAAAYEFPPELASLSRSQSIAAGCGPCAIAEHRWHGCRHVLPAWLRTADQRC